MSKSILVHGTVLAGNCDVSGIFVTFMTQLAAHIHIEQSTTIQNEYYDVTKK